VIEAMASAGAPKAWGETPSGERGQATGGPRRRGLALSLRTREALAITLLTFLVVVTTTVVHLSHLRRTILEDTLERAELIARHVYASGARALAQASREPALLALRRDRELRQLLDATVGYSPHLLYALIADRTGLTVLHSDPRREGTVAPARADFREFLRTDLPWPIRTFRRAEEIYEAVLPLDLDGRPFGAIRLGIATSLVERELGTALRRSLALGALALLAALAVAIGLSSVTLRPIRQLADDMDRLRRGEFDVGSERGPRDEFGKLAFQLQLLGREIHSDRTRMLAEKARLQTAVDQLEDGLVFLDPRRRVLFANRAAEAALDAPLGGPAAPTFDAALSPDHPLRRLVDDALERAVSAHRIPLAVAGSARTPELLASVFPVEGPDRAASGVIVLLRDTRSIAVSARTLQALIRYASQLMALGQTTSSVAHDVKNPLNAMTIHLELLSARLTDMPDEVRRSLDVIRAEIGRLDAVVQRFMALVRPQELALKALDLNALLREVASLLEIEWHPRGVRFDVQLDRTLPSLPGDEELLHRAFLNLVLNACQAMPGGGRLTLASQREDDDFARVSVADTGAGIPPEDLTRIFTMYYTTKPDGSGIGLALVRRIVEAHDGAIEVTSEVGQGTQVTLRLPLRPTP
jgi:signal transduction histidine kinase/HAMP domain-containing protein